VLVEWTVSGHGRVDTVGRQVMWSSWLRPAVHLMIVGVVVVATTVDYQRDNAVGLFVR